ncbi:MAG TPA: phosphoribosylamine--glycine ligase [Balneolaceae bacterium]|nr:phosphoribosylamine--glycine ligase [Balneolaceae bacterium]
MDQYNVLLIGSGGREHTIAWKLSQSEKLGTLFIAPGNPGTSIYGKNIDLNLSDFGEIAAFAEEKRVDLVVIGPEAPLVNGLADYLIERNIAVFGPRKRAAMLEGSKEFAKDFMSRYNIPTAGYEVFNSDDFDDVLVYVQTRDTYPIVLKADGLAGGKGVFICKNEEEVREVLDLLKSDENLSRAASKLVVEDFMEGEEASVFVISDGHTSHILHNAQDHKRIGDHDTGPNTGGMGAYSPAPLVTDELIEEIRQSIVDPTITGMQVEESAYTGILYVGLMITPEGPKVVEYNCRFGDPECQVILPSLKNDLLDLFLSVSEQRLDEKTIQLDGKYRCCVVLASEGYPGQYETGYEITGLDSVDENCLVFHAGTRKGSDSKITTSGGRVLNVVGEGETLKAAIDHAYENAEKIKFENIYYRKDIGSKGLKRLS